MWEWTLQTLGVSMPQLAKLVIGFRVVSELRFSSKLSGEDNVCKIYECSSLALIM
jgi:hypothetical protein